MRILVAEDNAVNRQIMAKILAKLGHQVDFACNGKEAVAAVAQRHYDMAFMDVQMPEMDGYAATRAIRALAVAGGDLPIAALTANASDEDRAICLAAGMNAYTTKPVSVAKLEAVIGELTEGRKAVPDVAYRPVEGLPELDMKAREALTDEIGAEAMAELDAQLALDVEDLLNGIRGAAARGDVAALKIAAHTLRGASSSLGYSGIVRACDRLRDVCHGPGAVRQLPDAVGGLGKACACIIRHEEEQTVRAVA